MDADAQAAEHAAFVAGWIQAVVGVIVGLGAATIAGLFGVFQQKQRDHAQRRSVMMEYAGALSDMAMVIGDILEGDPSHQTTFVQAEARLESARRDFNQYLFEFYGTEHAQLLRYPRFPTTKAAKAISDEAMNHYQRLAQIVEAYLNGTQKPPRINREVRKSNPPAP